MTSRLQQTLVVHRGSPSTPIEQQLGAAERTQQEEEDMGTTLAAGNLSSPFYHQFSDTDAAMSSFSTVNARGLSNLRGCLSRARPLLSRDRS